jgi:methyl coenzyme M reductase subunit C-like uncharacterized protein (methanogenesis marker protein 7)
LGSSISHYQKNYRAKLNMASRATTSGHIIIKLFGYERQITETSNHDERYRVSSWHLIKKKKQQKMLFNHG